MYHYLLHKNGNSAINRKLLQTKLPHTKPEISRNNIEHTRFYSLKIFLTKEKCKLHTKLSGIGIYTIYIESNLIQKEI